MGEDRFSSLVDEVKKAGSVLLSFWPGSDLEVDKDLQIEVKDDGSRVTEADMRSNDLILKALGGLFPNDGILSEEVPRSPSLSDKARIWIVDPLDGTHHFISGEDDFSILVGLTENGIPKEGIMYFPAKNYMVLSTGDGAATINGERLSVSTSPIPREGSIYFRNLDSVPEPSLASPMVDSGMALLNVARGVFDGVIIKLKTHKEWDLAAPTAVIEGAGGRVTDGVGEPIRYGQEEFNYGYVVASNGLVHDQLLSYLSK